MLPHIHWQIIIFTAMSKQYAKAKLPFIKIIFYARSRNLYKNIFKRRMHSSGMRSDCQLTVAKPNPSLTLFIPGPKPMANLCSKPDQWDSLPPHAAITNGLIIFGLDVMCATEMGLQSRTVYNCFMICIFNSCDKNGKNLP